MGNKLLRSLKVLTALLLTTLAGPHAAENDTIMAIFAHPDDESTVSPLLARYVREGTSVVIVIATDGRYGTNEFSEHEAGDGLAAVRRVEMQCAADALGAELVHLRYHDQLRSGEGYDGHMPHVRELLRDVATLIENTSPDALITWGPDGGSNHMDHRLVGATVSNVYLGRRWNRSFPLFYVGTPAERINNDDERLLHGVDLTYLNASIAFERRDLETAYRAQQCHRSQFSAAMLERWFQARSDGDFLIHFREFTAASERRDDILH